MARLEARMPWYFSDTTLGVAIGFLGIAFGGWLVARERYDRNRVEVGAVRSRVEEEGGGARRVVAWRVRFSGRAVGKATVSGKMTVTSPSPSGAAKESGPERGQ